tara:strand:+ start:195 stop:431 length:237 start_codon:yes stop_codon:yes gene_type:complete
MRYAVMFQIDENEWVYASSENPFDHNSPVVTFTTHEAASKEAGKYHTGVVVEKDGDLRELDSSERQRSAVRSRINRRS